MRPMIGLLGILALMEGIALLPAAFAEQNPGNPEPSAIPSASTGQGNSIAGSVNESVGNAASKVKQNMKSAHHKVSHPALKNSALRAKATTRTAPRAHARPTTSIGRVNVALQADRRLKGAHAYATPRGPVVLYGKVFDDQDSRLAEQTASKVRGVRHVIDHLETCTGQWTQEQVRINYALLQIDALQDVSAHVIGHEAFLWGQVGSESDKANAARVVSSFSNLQVVNLIRVVPGPLFSIPVLLSSRSAGS